MAIIDSPRRRATAQCQILGEADVAKIAMISCTPASLERDASIFVKAGSKLSWVQVLDQFWFGNHFEIVGMFYR